MYMQAFTLRQLASYWQKMPSFDTQQALIQGVAVDSRQVLPGNIFFALSGQKTDGHFHIPQAVQQGAKALVVSTKYAGPTFSLPTFYVDSPLECLQTLAKCSVEKLQAKIIAITGSLGKTTTKELLYCLLKPCYKVMATRGNQNSQVGLPLSIINQINGDEEILVLEMGINGEGQLQKLLSIASPHIALVTHIASVHRAGFSSLQAIAKAKGELFSHSKTELGILFAESAHLDLASQQGTCPKRLFSMQKEHPTAYWKMDVRERQYVEVIEGDVSVHLPYISFPLFHCYQNFLGALAAARSIGVSWTQIEQGMSDLSMPARRFEEKVKQGIIFIDDAYNACEESMLAAFEAVRKRECQGRKIAVLGEILEMGETSQETHLRVCEASLQVFDMVIYFGKNWPTVKRAGKIVESFSEKNELIEYLKAILVEKDLVLLKGGLLSRLEEVLEAFEERREK